MKNIKNLFVLFLLVIPMFLFAKPVLKNDAGIVAKNYYFEKTGVKQNEIIFEESYSYKIDNEVAFYIFNVKGEKGFIFVSADDNYFPVIAFSSNSEIKIKDLPDNIIDLYNILAGKIRYSAKNKLTENEKIKQLWLKYSASSQKNISQKGTKGTVLVTANWNQDGDYDDWIPFDENGTPPTGCVATAMGIIMKYWNYPQQGSGQTSYYAYPYGTLSANFTDSRYFWNLMDDNSGNTFSAHLLFHCGVAVHMNYQLDGSGAYVEYGPNSAYNALKNYFGYSTNLNYKSQNSYTDSQWKIFLKDEIDAGRVMLYKGSNSSGGHAWVCDGYNNSDLFHFNMGWGGYNNGYYDINNVSGFDTDMGAIMNIYPDGNNSYQGPPQNLAVELDTVNINDFTVELNWEAPGVSGVNTYKVYRIDYDSISFHHVFTEIAEVSSSAYSYTDNSAEAGNKEYIVQAVYTDGSGEAVASFLKGAFNITFNLYDTNGNNITSNGINAQVIFNNKTQNTGFGSTTFSNVIFGQNKPWIALADGYPTTSGSVNVYKDNSFNIVLDGGTNDIEYINKNIKLFPNPVKDRLFIDISDINGNNTFQIIDINGKLIQKGSVNSREMSINTQNIKPGFYTLKLNSDNTILYKSFIKQ